MSVTPVAAPVHQIPDQIADLARAIAAGGRTVTRAFVDRWSLPPEQALVAYLPSASAGLRIMFTTSNTHTILFFFHVKDPVKVIFDATVSFQVNSVSDLGPPDSPSKIDGLRVSFRLPSFLVAFPTRDQLDKFGFGAASTQQNTSLLALGPEHSDYLAVMNPEKGKDASIRFSPAGVPGLVEPKNGKYSLAWVLSFVQTLSSWVASDLQGSAARHIVLTSDETTVAGVIFYLLQAFVQSNQALLQPGDAVRQLPEVFQKTYCVNQYQADIKLRLRPDGTLADADVPDTSQLTLSIRVNDTRPPAAEITAVPNELSIAGPLRDAFLRALQFDVMRSTWARLLHVNQGFVGPFFDSAAETAAIFRIARDKSLDTDVAVLTGELQGALKTVVLTAQFKVNAAADPPKVGLPDEDSIIMLAIAPGDGGNVVVGYDPVKFVVNFLTNLHRWMGDLA
ncbi:MAG TPA: hypothetical protein VE779_00255 [Candidatus Angelobacter sp.]|nr:hypothetical protein [Candidatus Angelobacter sp.]